MAAHENSAPGLIEAAIHVFSLMTDTDALDRFRNVQASPRSGFATAIAELLKGEKRSHWIWYVLPQVEGLGLSTLAERYAITDIAEACDYMADPVLGPRLAEAFTAIAGHVAAGAQLRTVMGGQTDALKTVSSATLFAAVEGVAAGPAGRVLELAAAQGFRPCAVTLRALAEWGR